MLELGPITQAHWFSELHIFESCPLGRSLKVEVLRSQTLCSSGRRSWDFASDHTWGLTDCVSDSLIQVFSFIHLICRNHSASGLDLFQENCSVCAVVGCPKEESWGRVPSFKI